MIDTQSRAQKMCDAARAEMNIGIAAGQPTGKDSAIIAQLNSGVNKQSVCANYNLHETEPLQLADTARVIPISRPMTASPTVIPAAEPDFFMFPFGELLG